MKTVPILLGALLLAAPLWAAPTKSLGEDKFTVPEGWKQGNQGGRKSREVFVITKGRARLSVRAVGEGLTARDCKERTLRKNVEVRKAGVKPSEPFPIAAAKGFSGYSASVDEDDGAVTYYGYFSRSGKSYYFMLADGSEAAYDEVMPALGASPKAAEKGARKEDSRPKLKPVVYSTDKPSRPGPKAEFQVAPR